MISEARARLEGVVEATATMPGLDQTQQHSATTMLLDDAGTIDMDSHARHSTTISSPQSRSHSKTQRKGEAFRMDPKLHLITPKDKFLAHVGARVFCQGRWGVVTKAYPDNDPPAVYIRLDDGSDANYAQTIYLNGANGSPQIGIMPPNETAIRHARMRFEATKRGPGLPRY